MGTSRPIATATAVLALLALATPAAAGGGEKRPRPLTVEVDGDSAPATLGSYCVTHGTRGICSDSVYPLPVRGGVRVSPGDRVTLRTGDRAIERVTVGLLRVRGRRIDSTDWRAAAKRVRGRPRRFRFTLPADLERANRLDVFVSYRDRIGDASFWARITR